MFCHKCGTKAVEGAAFCQNCGEKLIVDPFSPRPAEGIAPPSVSMQQPGYPSPAVSTQPVSVAAAPPKKKKSKLLPIILAAVLLLVVFLVFLAFLGSEDEDTPSSQDTQNAGLAESSGEPAGSDAADGQILFRGESVLSFVGKPSEAIVDVFGEPTGGTPVTGELLFGGTVFYTYDGISFWFDDQDKVMNILVGAELLELNGESLNKTRSGILDLLGTPAQEEQLPEDESGEGFGGYYMMRYSMEEYGADMILELPDMDGVAYTVQISPAAGEYPFGGDEGMPGYTSYANEKEGIYFSYPSDWVIDHGGATEHTVLLIKEPSADGPCANLHITKDTDPGTQMILSASDAEIIAVYSMVGDMEIISIDDVMISGYPAKRVEMSVAGSITTGRLIQYFYAAGEQVFCLGFTIRDENLMEFAPVVDEIMNSYTITEPADNGDPSPAAGNKYYAEHPKVPDFGTLIGAAPFEISPRSDGWTYNYYSEDVTEQHIQQYHELLIDEGFQLVGADTFLIYEKGRTSVWFGSAMGNIMVAVYE